MLFLEHGRDGVNSLHLFNEVGRGVTVKNISFDQTIKLLDRLENYHDFPIEIKKLTLKSDKRNLSLMKTVSFSVATMMPK